MPDSLKHLLLVEDEGPLRQAIAEQLGDRGYQVKQADSGEAPRLSPNGSEKSTRARSRKRMKGNWFPVDAT